jgi:hypothetical protein
MHCTVLITVSTTSISWGHSSSVASDSRCIIQCVHLASAAGRLIKACSHLYPAIMRAAAVHMPTQSDHFMLFLS